MCAPHMYTLQRMRKEEVRFKVSPSKKTLYYCPPELHCFFPYYQAIKALTQVPEDITCVKVYVYCDDFDSDRAFRNFSIASSFLDDDVAQARWRLDVPYGVLYRPSRYFLFRVRRIGLVDLADSKKRSRNDIGLRITYGHLGHRKREIKLQFETGYAYRMY